MINVKCRKLSADLFNCFLFGIYLKFILEYLPHQYHRPGYNFNFP